MEESTRMRSHHDARGAHWFPAAGSDGQEPPGKRRARLSDDSYPCACSAVQRIGSISGYRSRFETTWRSIGHPEQCPRAPRRLSGSYLGARTKSSNLVRDARQPRPAKAQEGVRGRRNKNYKAYINYMIFTGIFDLPNYRRPMRYFFHILDGPKVYPDECGISFSGPELAVLQARSLALELRKAGALCRSNLVLVLDETGGIIFNCWVRATSRTPPVHGKAKTQ